ncbi:MAG: HigA family addiction module antidote protein [Chlamydiia bacterium]|nr:HigA family addiction module antidote protein [Chlamydiia bacterium]MCP5510226.1 HigA family addiction module antidote protein [Chlamydiales bacterium]
MLPSHRKPTAPGRILLEEFLIPLGLTQSEFVKYLGGSWTQPKLSSIISGKKSITEAIALDLADTLGTTPEFWIGLQIDVKLWNATQKRKPLAKIPRRKIRKTTLIN